MFPLVCLWIGRGGTAQEAEAHDIVTNIMTVFAVVEQADAVIALAQVHPLLRARLEARPVPACVVVGGTLHITPLDLVGRYRAENIDREGDFEQDVALAPVDAVLYVEARAVIAQRDALGICAAQDLPLDLQGRAQPAGFDHLD